MKTKDLHHRDFSSLKMDKVELSADSSLLFDHGVASCFEVSRKDDTPSGDDPMPEFAGDDTQTARHFGTPNQRIGIVADL